MQAGVRMLFEPLCPTMPPASSPFLVLQLPPTTTFSGCLGAPVFAGSPRVPFLPPPADSGRAGGGGWGGWSLLVDQSLGIFTGQASCGAVGSQPCLH